MTVLQDEYRAGMRQLAAAVNLITAGSEGRRAGMTATAVMSLTAEPPQLGVAVNRSNASCAVIQDSGAFAVNVLSHDQSDLAAAFAGATGLKGEERFSLGKWETLATGAPVLAESAASFDCRVERVVEFTSHVLVVGLVEAVRTTPVTTPLLYMDGRWASLVRAADEQIAAYEGIVDAVADAIEDTLASDGSAMKQLVRFSRSFIELNAAQIDVMRQFHSQEQFAPADRLTRINLRKREVEEKLQSILEKGRASGEFAISDPAVAAHAIIGMLNSIHRWPSQGGMSGECQLANDVGTFVSAMVRAS